LKPSAILRYRAAALMPLRQCFAMFCNTIQGGPKSKPLQIIINKSYYIVLNPGNKTRFFQIKCGKLAL